MALKISRILHAGYVFECGDTLIAFDPIFENPFSRNCHAFPDVRFDHAQIRNLAFDAVFISHFHDDHCSLESLDFLDRRTPIHIYCLFDELFAMVRELGFLDVQPLRIDVPVAVGPFEVIPREALDSDVDSMFQIKAAGLNVLNVVDSWMDPDTLDQLAKDAPWDMVLWPFQTMREIDVLSPSRATPAPPQLPGDWIDQLKILNPRYVVPSSCQFLQEAWSWYNRAFFPITYRQFQHDVEAALPDTRVVRLNPSVSVTLDATSLQASTPLPWVVPVGEQDVDYQYDATLPAPHTADIARRFPALTAPQADRVLDYEPAAKQRAPAELNRFTVQNYLLVAHMAALRLLLQRYAEGMPRAEVEAALDGAFARVRSSLASTPGDTSAETGAPANTAEQWPGWAPLQRRLRLLQQDAAEVSLASRAIGDALDTAGQGRPQ